MKLLSKQLLFFAFICASVHVSGCKNSSDRSGNSNDAAQQEFPLDAHPINTLLRYHFPASSLGVWSGPLEKSVTNEDYIGRANFNPNSLFADNLIVAGGVEIAYTGSAIIAVNADWKEAANRLILRMPRPWWRIIPLGAQDNRQTALGQGKGSLTSDELEKKEGISFLAVPKTRQQELEKVYFIDIQPLEKDNTKTKVFIESLTWVSVQQNEDDNSAIQDRDRRLFAQNDPVDYKRQVENEKRIDLLVKSCFDAELGVVAQNAARFNPKADPNQFEFDDTDLWASSDYIENRKQENARNENEYPKCPTVPPVRMRMTTKIEEARQITYGSQNMCFDRKTGNIIARNGVQGKSRSFYISVGAQKYFIECETEDYVLHRPENYEYIK